jgi:alkyl hydroperoxide reductase subunit F
MEFPEIILDISSLSPIRKPDQNTVYDILILGGGPAAMSAAVYAARKMVNVAIVTLDFGGLMRETSEIENYLGYQNINAKDLVLRFEEHVKSFDIPINLGVSIIEIKKKNNIFIVLMEDATTFSSHTVVYATGERHRQLLISGEKEFIGKGVSYCSTCDAPLFKNKKVIIAGGGNSAFTTAFDLLRANADVVLVNFISGWQADETLKQRVLKFEKIKLLDFHEILRIEGKDKIETVVIRDRKTSEEKPVNADGIFIEIGLLPNSEPVKNLVELNKQGEVIVDSFCRTNVPGLFAAGDVTSIPYKQIIISAGEGAKAALAAYDYLIKTLKYN